MDDTIDIVIGKLKKPQNLAAPKHHRSSYTKETAAMVQPIMDKLLGDGADVFVPAANTGYSANTLYGKLNDGLLWLMHNTAEKDKNEAYRMLRTQVSMRKMDDGVLIYFKAAVRDIKRTPSKPALEGVSADGVKWRHDLLSWLQRSQEGEMFKADVMTDDDDQRWVYDNIATHAPNAEVIFGDDNIKLIR